MDAESVTSTQNNELMSTFHCSRPKKLSSDTLGDRDYAPAVLVNFLIGEASIKAADAPEV